MQQLHGFVAVVAAENEALSILETQESVRIDTRTSFEKGECKIVSQMQKRLSVEYSIDI